MIKKKWEKESKVRKKKKSERSKEVHMSIKRSKDSIHTPGKRTLV